MGKHNGITVVVRPQEELEGKIGYSFKDKELLAAALTHRSYRFEDPDCEVDNQRLEFLGDAVVGLLIANWAFENFKGRDEGILTEVRRRIVNEHGLAMAGKSIGLGEHIRLGKGEYVHNGMDRESTISDAVEAMFAALYLDGGLRVAERVFRRVFREQLTGASDDIWEGNPKGKLQHIVNHEFQEVPVYQMLPGDGPGNNLRFKASVAVRGISAIGAGHSKQAAQVAAAAALLRILENPKLRESALAEAAARKQAAVAARDAESARQAPPSADAAAAMHNFLAPRK